MARHRIARFNNRNWFVIRGQEGSGSGFSLYGETWYQVGDKGVRAVLSYPVEGNTYPWPTGLGREFKAHTQEEKQATSDVGIRVRYAVTYTTLDYVKNDFRALFHNEHYLHYVWDKVNATFAFDGRKSSITEAEALAIANIEPEDDPTLGQKIGNTTFYSQSEAKAFIGGGYEVFLKYNSRRLMKIAKGKKPREREWLRQFLNDCHDTEERRALLRVLQIN